MARNYNAMRPRGGGPLVRCRGRGAGGSRGHRGHKLIQGARSRRIQGSQGAQTDPGVEGPGEKDMTQIEARVAK